MIEPIDATMKGTIFGSSSKNYFSHDISTTKHTEPKDIAWNAEPPCDSVRTGELRNRLESRTTNPFSWTLQIDHQPEVDNTSTSLEKVKFGYYYY